MYKKERLDCHVFIPDDTRFEGYIKITGDLIAGNNVHVRSDISVGGDAYFKNNANVLSIEAGGDVVFGDNADTCDIETGGDLTFGDNPNFCNIEAVGDVFLGAYCTAKNNMPKNKWLPKHAGTNVLACNFFINKIIDKKGMLIYNTCI